MIALSALGDVSSPLKDVIEAFLQNFFASLLLIAVLAFCDTLLGLTIWLFLIDVVFSVSVFNFPELIASELPSNTLLAVNVAFGDTRISLHENPDDWLDFLSFKVLRLDFYSVSIVRRSIISRKSSILAWPIEPSPMKLSPFYIWRELGGWALSVGAAIYVFSSSPLRSLQNFPVLCIGSLLVWEAGYGYF